MSSERREVGLPLLQEHEARQSPFQPLRCSFPALVQWGASSALPCSLLQSKGQVPVQRHRICTQTDADGAGQDDAPSTRFSPSCRS